MTEKELGKALLQLDMAPATAGPRQLTQQILQRGRWRMRLLAIVTILFWTLAVAGAVSLVAFYFLQVDPRLRAYAAGRAQLQKDWDAWAMAFGLAARVI